MTDVDPIEAEEILWDLFREETEHGNGNFFVHIGLPRTATWSEFRIHYDRNGVADCNRAAADILGYPPIAERFLELEAGREGHLIWLKDRVEGQRIKGNAINLNRSE